MEPWKKRHESGKKERERKPPKLSFLGYRHTIYSVNICAVRTSFDLSWKSALVAGYHPTHISTSPQSIDPRLPPPLHCYHHTTVPPTTTTAATTMPRLTRKYRSPSPSDTSGSDTGGSPPPKKPRSESPAPARFLPPATDSSGRPMFNRVQIAKHKSAGAGEAGKKKDKDKDKDDDDLLSFFHRARGPTKAELSSSDDDDDGELRVARKSRGNQKGKGGKQRQKRELRSSDEEGRRREKQQLKERYVPRFSRVGGCGWRGD